MSADVSKDNMLTMQEVARRLNVSLPTIYRRINLDPDFVTFTVGKRRRMREAVLNNWIRKQEQKAA